MSSIDIFPWDKNFNTGLAIIDEQHQRLVQILNQLATHMAHQSDAPELNLIFDELSDYTQYHFQEEESIWHSYFPDDILEAQHKALHKSFILTLGHLKNAANFKPLDSVIEEALTFLTRWLASHILEKDRYMAMVVHEMKSGMSLESAQAQAKERMSGTMKLLIDIILSTYSNHVTNTLHLMKEIADHSQAEESLRESQIRFRTIIEESPIGIAFGSQGITRDVNAVYLKMFGFADKAEVIGHFLTDQIAPQCKAEVADRSRRRDQGEEVESSYETIGLRKDGSQFPLFITAKHLVLKDGPITFAFLMDITQRKESEDKIRQLAFYDSLTGLPNRELLLDRLRQSLISSGRSGKEGAIFFIDLDNFKNLNDTRGHDVGDMLLKLVAERITSCVRTGDTVARLGGDEFVVVLEDLSNHMLEAAEQTESVGNKILDTLKQAYHLGGHTHHCTSSIGATLFGNHKHSIDELLKQADIAMYEAKRAGRNTIRFFDPKMQSEVDARAGIEVELRKAIDNNEFKLYYQIQVEGSHDHRPFGAEALIRWIHPERGLISPADFIPVAEENGLIQTIGWWVLKTACIQIKAWQNEPLTCNLVLSINVSAKQFHQPDFVDQIKTAIQLYDIKPNLLKLELTEGMLLENIEATIAKMSTLKNIGVSFSLDDFGTGYSSLSYLSRLPLDHLKIDRTFVMNLGTKDDSVAICSAIIRMAHSLKLKVVAEGVENETQTYILSSVHRCNYLQGYLFGKPLPIDQFEALLKKTRQSSSKSLC